MKDTILKKLGQNLLLACVGLPTLLIACYSTFLAEKELTATATAIVKENQRSSGSAIPGFASALFDYGNKTSLEDAYLLQSFLQSEGFIMKLNHTLQLDQHFSENGFPLVQRLTRSPAPGDLYTYLLDRLSIQLSVDSSIITLQFRSFDPELSERTLDFVISEAETKINDLAQRMTTSRMALARAELDLAEEELQSANQAILAFQTKNAWLNESEVVAAFNQIEALRARLLDARIERQKLLLSMRPESPRIQALDADIQATDNALAELNQDLMQNDSNSSVTLASEFGAFNLSLEFAQNKYSAATAALQQAQLEASQQHKFLLLISPAKAESTPVAPKPLHATLTTFVVSLLAFLVIRLVVLTIKDHTI